MEQYAQTEARIRNARHAYYGMISYIDDKVGQILQALQATGLNQETIIIFTADHGEMLGERGLWYKMNFFEWSARVPLIFYAPDRFSAGRIARQVSLVDLLPTLVELGGGGTSPDFADNVDGHSLAPLLRGDEQNWPDTVFGEMLAEGAIAPCLMIRRGPYKYIYSEPDPEQLYDLTADPYELNNLAGRPEHEPVRRAFQTELLARWQPQALRQQVIDSQRRRRLIHQALMTGRYTPWDFQPVRDASQQYMRNHLDLNDLERRARFPSPELPEPDFLVKRQLM
jgi:choline-sulfatase